MSNNLTAAYLHDISTIQVHTLTKATHGAWQQIDFITADGSKFSLTAFYMDGCDGLTPNVPPPEHTKRADDLPRQPKTAE
jgi:hypothetical protein